MNAAPDDGDRAHARPERADARSGRLARAGALALGTGLALCVLGIVLLARARREPAVRLHAVGDTFRAALAERTARPVAPDVVALDEPDPLALPLATARQLFGVDLPGNVYEARSYFHGTPGLDVLVAFPEHPAGAVRLRTNSLGMREDVEVPQRRPDLRVLVTGDSHTEGSCANSESYCNRLEALLAAAHPGRAIECWNAGKGGYSFHNYLGTLRRLAHLEPDVFVVGVYGGNDFEELLTPWHYFQGTPRPGLPAEHHGALRAAAESHPDQVAQGLMQLVRFRHVEGEAETALQAAVALSAEIAGECRGRGIAPLFVYIPPRWLQDPAYAREPFAANGIGRREIQAAGELADRWLASLRALGIPTHDLRPTLSAGTEPLYWQDGHVNLAAHERIARDLARRIGPLLEARAR